MGLLADDRPARVPVDDNQISVTHITEIISTEVLPRSRRQNWGSGGSFAWEGAILLQEAQASLALRVDAWPVYGLACPRNHGRGAVVGRVEDLRHAFLSGGGIL